MATARRNSIRLTERQERSAAEERRLRCIAEATGKLEQILEDFEQFTSRYSYPYTEQDVLLFGSSNWGRYNLAVKFWSSKEYANQITPKSKELIAILMCSVAFQKSLFLDNDEEFQVLLELIYTYTNSICMFASARRVPWREIYNEFRNSSPFFDMMAQALPILREPFKEPSLHERFAYSLPPTSPDPHLLYLDKHGIVQRSAWKQDSINGGNFMFWPMENGKENVYQLNDFIGSTRPRGWPSTWGYPANPSHLARKHENNPHDFFPCFGCGATRLGMCQCSIPIPRVEIFEHGRIRGRGVRTLSRIQKNQILGELIGRFIPLGSQKQHRDESYAMEFEGQPISDVENAPGIATLISGQFGNWARFMNAPSRHQKAQWESQGNVSFHSEVFAERLRVLVIANQDIAFGEELLVSYGKMYASKEARCN